MANDTALVFNSAANSVDSDAAIMRAQVSIVDATALARDSDSSVAGAAAGSASDVAARSAAAAETDTYVLSEPSASPPEHDSGAGQPPKCDSHGDKAGESGADEGAEAAGSSAAVSGTNDTAIKRGSAQQAEFNEKRTSNTADVPAADPLGVGLKADSPSATAAAGAEEGRAIAADSTDERETGVQEARLRAEAAMAESITAHVRPASVITF